jgi:hypothetical protein
MKKDTEFKPDKKYFLNFIYENLLSTTKRVILFDGKIIKKSNDILEYNFLDFYEQYCKESFLEYLEVPHMILNFSGSIKNLEQLGYDSIIQSYLNDKGLHIYLLDQLQFSKDKKKIYIEANGDFPYDQLSLNLETYDETYNCLELDSILDFVKNNNLKNVFVYTREDNTEALQRKYQSIKIKHLNLHISTYSHFKEYRIKNSNVEKIEKKFICINKRFEPHRYLMTAYLAANNDTFVSFLSKPKIDPLITLKNSMQSLNINPKSHGEDTLKRLVKGSKILGHSDIFSLPFDDEKNELFPPIMSIFKSFCFVVTETTFIHPFPVITEKTITPIECMRPFILVAPAYSLKSLKNMGFKTFDSWWDESYDEEISSEKRFLKIVSTINYIENMSIEQLKNLYNEMSSVLTHNLKNLKEVQSGKIK